MDFEETDGRGRSFAEEDRERPCIRITVHVLDKQIPISCGMGSQKIKWLGSVGIARYDEKDLQGWRTLGIPSTITRMSGEELDMGLTIRDVLRDKDHVTIIPSIKPPESKPPSS